MKTMKKTKKMANGGPTKSSSYKPLTPQEKEYKKKSVSVDTYDALYPFRNSSKDKKPTPMPKSTPLSDKQMVKKMKNGGKASTAKKMMNGGYGKKKMK